MKEKDLNALIRKLQLQLSQSELLEKIQNQIHKDFERSGLPGFKLNNPNPASWNAQIQAFLKQLNSGELSHLLYLIDVPEIILIQTDTSEDRLFYLSNAILHRELLKVFYQIRYK
ncbi:hypothetical protein [Fluviicola sp.]|jgi:hypothetical protein|uniref:hypothetical protein n=1 Tax=Fluviicola sp. TaxID=1917219 RepID=UPI0028201274|nr:hypothetical protein [Fluviicola sp.]MDR0802638.1 hypothetical protein [Fluviicola sp.]